MASKRLCSRSPFPNNREDKSGLSVPLRTLTPPAGLLRGPLGELWALGVLRERGGEGWGGVRSCHTGGGVALRSKEEIRTY